MPRRVNASGPTLATVSIDGSSIGNGRGNPSGGYGIVFRVGSAHAEISATLCVNCDRPQTNNRAELRALEEAACFLHELVKNGSHDSCAVRSADGSRSRGGALSDNRSISAGGWQVTVRSDSTYVLRGAQGTHNVRTHRDVWAHIRRVMRCMNSAGMTMLFEHVPGHSGDRDNERADTLARRMASGFEPGDTLLEAACTSCAIEFEDSIELAVHFKEAHLGRDVERESLLDALARGQETGEYCCTKCSRVFGSDFSLVQHVDAKHDI